jgi:hypothetical protein
MLSGQTAKELVGEIPQTAVPPDDVVSGMSDREFQQLKPQGREHHLHLCHIKSLRDEIKGHVTRTMELDRRLVSSIEQNQSMAVRLGELEQAQRANRYVSAWGTAGVTGGGLTLSVVSIAATLCPSYNMLYFATCGVGIGFTVAGLGLMLGLVRRLWPERH